MSEGNTAPGTSAPGQSQSAEPNDPKTGTTTVPNVDTASAEAKQTQSASATEGAKAKEAERKYKLKVNGQEREVDEKTAMAWAQRGMAADEKFQQAAQKQKQIDRLVQLAKDDPDQLLAELTGKDPTEIYKSKLKERLEKLSMDPRERELHEAKSKLEAYERAEAARKAEAEKLNLDRATQFYIQKYDKELPEAIKAAGLPLTEDVIKATAEIMMLNLEQGMDLPYELVMELVKDRYKRSFTGFLSASDMDALIDLFGEEKVDALFAAKAKRKAPKAAQPAATKPAVSAADKKEKPYMTPDELKEYVANWAKDGK